MTPEQETARRYWPEDYKEPKPVKPKLEKKPETMPIKPENNTEACQRTEGCLRGPKHQGWCSTRTAEDRRKHKNENQNATRKAVKQTGQASQAPEVTAGVPAVIEQLPRCRFKIEFEEIHTDGETDQFVMTGRSRAQFDRVIVALNSLIHG